MTISRQIVKISALAVLAVIFSVLALFVIKDKISAKVNQISQRRTMVMSLDKRENNFVNLKKDYQIVKTELPEAKSLFPGIDDMDAFIDSTDNLSNELGGNKTIKFENNPELFGTNVNKLNFTLVFSGKKEFFSKFLEQLTRLPYFTKINKIDIKNSQDPAADPDAMTITASIFLKK